MKRNVFLASLVFICHCYLPASALDIVLDEKAVEVPLPVNKEIIIKFPMAVTHTELLDDDNSENNTDSLRQLLRPDGVLMLSAGKPFGKTRLIATMIDGNIVVLDLHAQIGAINHETITLIDKKSQLAKTKTTASKSIQVKPLRNPYKPDFLKDGGVMTKNTATQHAIGFNQMVQYGLRHFTGPSRLIGKQVMATKVSLSRRGVSRWVRVWGNQLAIKPLKQWKINDDYVTVLLVNNLSARPVAFDPRALRGRLKFVAALSPVIQPQGSVNDQTLWAVITAVPFDTAIKP